MIRRIALITIALAVPHAAQAGDAEHRHDCQGWSHRVAMVGIVEDAEVARQAFDLVKRIRGVRKIDNRLISGHQMGWD